MVGVLAGFAETDVVAAQIKIAPMIAREDALAMLPLIDQRIHFRQARVVIERLAGAAKPI